VNVPGEVNLRTPERSRVELLTEVKFGADSKTRAQLLGGWSEPEEGFTWSVGPRSALNMRLPASIEPGDNIAVELQIRPFIVPDLLLGQRLAVRINGISICEEHICRSCTVLYPIPPNCLALPSLGGTKRLLMQFTHPDFGRPADYDMSEDQRPLALMFYTVRVFKRPVLPIVDVTSIPPLRIPKQSDQLENWLQTVVGLNAASLLKRFQIIKEHPEPDQISDFQSARFSISPQARDASFEELHALYPLFYNTLRDSSPNTKTSDDSVVSQAVEDASSELDAKRGSLRWAASSCADLIEHIRKGDSIFVVQRMGIITLSEARAFHLLLQGGHHNALLYLDQYPDMPSGAVEQREFGLFHGKLQHPVIWNAADISLQQESWISICVCTLRLWMVGKSALRVGDY